MDPWQALVAFGSAFVAGAINSVAGALTARLGTGSASPASQDTVYPIPATTGIHRHRPGPRPRPPEAAGPTGPAEPSERLERSVVTLIASTPYP